MTVATVSQVITKDVPRDNLPVALKPTEEIKEAVSWQWLDSIHYLIISETNEKVITDSLQSASIQTRYYICKDSITRLVWEHTDGVRNCGLHRFADLRPGSLHITDHDRDGITEIWWMYTVGCFEYYEAPELKLIMYTGGRRHVMSGTASIPFPLDNPSPGGYEFDESFRNCPRLIKKFARKIWSENKREVYTD